MGDRAPDHRIIRLSQEPRGAFREVQNVRFQAIVCDEVHHLAISSSADDVSDRHRLAQWVARAGDALILLSATPHSGYDASFASLLNLLEPTLVPDTGAMSYSQYGRHLIRRLRNRAAFDDLVGPSPGVLTTDRFAVYAHLPSDRRQLCWAHTIRTQSTKRSGAWLLLGSTSLPIARPRGILRDGA